MLTEYEVGTLPEDDLAKIKETQVPPIPTVLNNHVRLTMSWLDQHRSFSSW
jgi:hypothetical protein